MAKFVQGDTVAWSHNIAPVHGDGSIVRSSYVEATDPDAQVGIVNGAANEAETWFNVQFEDGERVLTGDELVKVQVS